MGWDVTVHRMYEAGRPLTAGIDGAADDTDIEIGVVAEAEAHERSLADDRVGLSDLALDGGEAPGLSCSAHGWLLRTSKVAESRASPGGLASRASTVPRSRVVSACATLTVPSDA